MCSLDTYIKVTAATMASNNPSRPPSAKTAERWVVFMLAPALPAIIEKRDYLATWLPRAVHPLPPRAACIPTANGSTRPAAAAAGVPPYLALFHRHSAAGIQPAHPP